MCFVININIIVVDNCSIFSVINTWPVSDWSVNQISLLPFWLLECQCTQCSVTRNEVSQNTEVPFLVLFGNHWFTYPKCRIVKSPASTPRPNQALYLMHKNPEGETFIGTGTNVRSRQCLHIKVTTTGATWEVGKPSYLTSWLLHFKQVGCSLAR